LKPISKIVCQVAFWSTPFCILAWHIACHRLFKLLESRHPKKFAAMGRPSLRMTAAITRAFARYLWRQEYLELDDPGIIRLSKSIRVLFVAFTIGLLLSYLGMSLGYAP
jgi:hypothetical protein